MGDSAAARACIVRTARSRRTPWRSPFIRDPVQHSVPRAARGRRRRRRGRSELSLAVARREEWREQVKFARLLDKWLDPVCSFWTATDPVAPSVTSGAMRKKRGVKPGVPDVLVWYRGRSITIELKSRRGQCSPSQRAARVAGGGAVVGVPLGDFGGVGAVSGGRAVSNPRRLRWPVRALGATHIGTVGAPQKRFARAGAKGAGLSGAGGGGDDRACGCA
jgi:hypothetical protein